MITKSWGIGLLLVAGTTGACAKLTGLDEFEMTGATATTGSGSGAGGPGGEGGAGGSANPLFTEQCGNGSDDDTDGLADCIDPDCSEAYTCVPLALDPVFVTMGPDCSEPFAQQELFDCGACGCTATPGACHIYGRLHDYYNCNGPADTFSTNDCHSFPGGGNSYPEMSLWLDDGEPLPNGAGNCTTTVDPSLQVCRLNDAVTCGAGTDLCAPHGTGISCVVVASTECPAAFPVARPVRTQPDTCGCSCVVQEECPAEVIIYNDFDCQGVDEIVEVFGPHCTTIQPSIPEVRSIGAPSPEATCTASSTPTGTERTLCCLD